MIEWTQWLLRRCCRLWHLGLSKRGLREWPGRLASLVVNRAAVHRRATPRLIQGLTAMGCSQLSRRDLRKSSGSTPSSSILRGITFHESSLTAAVTH